MIQKLIILGFLKKTPASGYDIKKLIEKELGIYSSLDNSSIYYPLKQLQAAGFIEGQDVQGEKHLKQLYSITPSGEKEFERLCQEELLSKKRPFIEIDIPLYFLEELDQQEAHKRLRWRRRFLASVREWLLVKLKDEKDLPAHHRLLLKHHLELLAAEEKFMLDMLTLLGG